MPTFKRVEFMANNKAGAVDKFTIPIEISADGVFYAHVPDKLKVSFPEKNICYKRRPREGFFLTRAHTFAELEARIRKAHEGFMEPAVTEEPVIRYNIESHVSFWLTSEGRIVPNGYFDKAHDDKHHRGGWNTGKEYGEHDASHATESGYSLTVGAKAMLKKTTTYGDKSHVEYKYYYGKEDDHFSQTDPAARLNAWSAMGIGDNSREMPYSDEAATFFFNLLKGMAELNRKIQEFTNTPEKLARLIARSSGALALIYDDQKKESQ